MSTTETEQPNVGQSEQPSYGDYWGSDEKDRYTFPDGRTFIEFQVMNEGSKSKFQKMTSQNLIVNRAGDATVKMDPAKERHELIINSCTDWNLHKNGEPILFSNRMLEKWLEVAPPKLVEDLEYAIRLANPWMQQEMSVDEIDKEVARLEEMRQQVREREAGEAVSANK